MAALFALGIDNCLIKVNGPEFPILDGSAQYYVNEIERVGTIEQNAVKDFYIIKSKIEFRDEKTGSSIIVLPDENFSLNVLVSYDSTILPNQFATLENMAKFKDEVAASRTFVFVREIEPLLQAGLIKGGDLANGPFNRSLFRHIMCIGCIRYKIISGCSIRIIRMNKQLVFITPFDGSSCIKIKRRAVSPYRNSR